MPASTTSISSSTAVDLSRLPAPTIVETLSFETILAAMKTDLVARAPEFTALIASDPAIKVLEVAAYRELLLRQRVNEAARACMIAYAIGADLDNLGALFGVTRLVRVPADPENDIEAVMEPDEDLRRRIVMAPDSYSVAGPASAYVFYAYSASGDVLDISATSPAPGEVAITVLSRTGDGSASPELLAAVEAAVAAPDVRPLTDHVIVQSVDLVPFQVNAQIYLYGGPDGGLIRQTAEANLTNYLTFSRRIGQDVTRSGIIAALHVTGVQRVDLLSPLADIVTGPTQAAYASDITVSLIGAVE